MAEIVNFESMPIADLNVDDERVLRLLTEKRYLVYDGKQYLVTLKGMHAGLAPKAEQEYLNPDDNPMGSAIP